MKLYMYYILALVISLTSAAFSACSSCDDRPAAKIRSDPIIMSGEDFYTEGSKVAEKDGIKRIDIRSRRNAGGEEGSVGGETATSEMRPVEPSLPPETYEDTALTERLREKMKGAYEGRESEMPDVKIYTSNLNYDEFVDYYRRLGYPLDTVEVPASEVIAPVLKQRPELASKINLKDYEGVTIRQVIVKGAGISAADKYIDPDTFAIVDKTFVTKTGKGGE